MQVQKSNRTGTAGPLLSGVMGRRAAAVVVTAAVACLAGACGGGDDAASGQDTEAVAADPTPGPVVQPARPGDLVRPGPQTPKGVARALAGTQVVVIAFLLPEAADDDAVGTAVKELRRSPVGSSGVRYFVYSIDRQENFGDLPEILGVTETPTVAVIARDHTLTNRWVGLVDSAILRQSVADAKANAPKASGDAP